MKLLIESILPVSYLVEGSILNIGIAYLERLSVCIIAYKLGVNRILVECLDDLLQYILILGSGYSAVVILVDYRIKAGAIEYVLNKLTCLWVVTIVNVTHQLPHECINIRGVR